MDITPLWRRKILFSNFSNEYLCIEMSRKMKYQNEIVDILDSLWQLPKYFLSVL